MSRWNKKDAQFDKSPQILIRLTGGLQAIIFIHDGTAAAKESLLRRVDGEKVCQLNSIKTLLHSFLF